MTPARPLTVASERRRRRDDRPHLTARAIRAAVLTPVIVLGLTVLVVGEARRPEVFVIAALAASALVLGGLTRPRLAALGGDRPSSTPVLIGALCTVLAVIAVVVTFGDDPQRFTGVFGVIIVAAAFVLPPPQRWPLVVWATLGWAASLWFGGVRDGTALITQLGGAVLLSVVALRTTASLEAALQIERAASQASHTRAALLASLLRLQSLEPATVAEAVVEGARTAGFDSAVLRVVEGPDLRLVAARPADGHVPPVHLPAFRGIAAAACRTRRTVVVGDDDTDHAETVDDEVGSHAAMAVPVLVGEEARWVLIAGRRGQALTSEQVQAVELLAEEAGAALRRARRFADDAADVAELRRVDERTSDFVSTVSHELRTPMTVIDGLGRTLDRRWDDLSPARRQDLLRRIDGNARRLAVMVGSLVDTSLLERGELLARPAPVDVNACIEAVAGRLGPLLEGHRTRFDVPPGLIVVADPALLEHVIENLLSNAVRHTPPGTSVTVGARRRGDEVEVEIEDGGPGIRAEDLPHIFERFYRAGEPTTRPSGGLGLGLALSQQILRAHGSELTVASEPGVGTRFAFRFPVAAAGP